MSIPSIMLLLFSLTFSIVVIYKSYFFIFGINLNMSFTWNSFICSFYCFFFYYFMLFLLHRLKMLVAVSIILDQTFLLMFLCYRPIFIIFFSYFFTNDRESYACTLLPLLALLLLIYLPFLSICLLLSLYNIGIRLRTLNNS